MTEYTKCNWCRKEIETESIRGMFKVFSITIRRRFKRWSEWIDDDLCKSCAKMAYKAVKKAKQEVKA